MANLRERPYSQFNYLVKLGEDANTDSFQAGFQEVSGLGMEITVAEYRNGNETDNTTRKITGTYKVPDVTLKRGVIGDLDLWNWLKEIREGRQDALKVVTILLQSENHNDIAMTWSLKNARPIKYTGPSLSAKGTDVAVEELVLACERIEIE